MTHPSRGATTWNTLRERWAEMPISEDSVYRTSTPPLGGTTTLPVRPCPVIWTAVASRPEMNRLTAWGDQLSPIAAQAASLGHWRGIANTKSVPQVVRGGR